MVTKILKTPWTPEQVEILYNRQACTLWHEYTCWCGAVLDPTEQGWVCPDCDYTQDWCHAGDAE